MTQQPICFQCVYFIDDTKYTCAAFPKGILEQILNGNFDHTKKHPDQDNDIVFEKAKGD